MCTSAATLLSRALLHDDAPVQVEWLEQVTGMDTEPYRNVVTSSSSPNGHHPASSS